MQTATVLDIGYVCTGCGEWKQEAKFRVDRAKPQGRNTRCKVCVKKQSRARVALNYERRLQAIAQCDTITCIKCDTTKVVQEFPSDPLRKEGSTHRCKTCTKKDLDKWVLKNREYVRKSSADGHYRRKYGITAEQKLNLISEQHGKCAICKTELSDNIHICVDHDHVTGLIRGILCRKCNTGIGQFSDDIEIIENALEYLRTHRGTT